MAKTAALIYRSAFHRTANELTKLLEIPKINATTARNTSTLEVVDVLINWGCNHLGGLYATKVLNSPAVTRRSVDKYAFLHMMHSYGIPSPGITNEYPGTHVANYVVRDKMGWGGRDLLKQVPISDPFWVEWVNKTREFRVYFAKRPNGEYKQAIREKIGDKNMPVWNFASGFQFNVVSDTESGLRKKLFNLCKSTTSLYPDIDFGALDIIMDDRERLLVLEMNTAPRLQMELYQGRMIAEAIKEHLNG